MKRLIAPFLIILGLVAVAWWRTPTVSAQQDLLTWFTIADISGTGSAVQLATSGVARLCQLQAPSTNASDVRWGDSNISSSRGAGIAAGGGQFIPPMGSAQHLGGPVEFTLSSTYVLIANGDKLRVTCAR